MFSPEQHGSSGFTDSDSSAESSHHPRRPSYPARAAASRGERGSYNFYTHPARTLVLSADGALLLDPALARLAPDMENSSRTDMANIWRSSGSLPSFSRAFDLFGAAEDADAAVDGPQDRFFVPSYLQASTYVQKLEEAHKAKLQAHKENKRAKGNGPDIGNASLNSSQLPPGSHRGMLHTVLERPPPLEDDDSLAPLPTRWNKDDMWGSLDIQPDGLRLKYSSRSHHDLDHEASAVRADRFVPPQCGIYYFEVRILSGKRDDTTIAVGFTTKSAALTRPVGWEPESWGYHGDDGRCFNGQNIGRHYGPIFSRDDVVGCGINFRDRSLFFTKNGVKIGVAFHDVSRGKLYPAISLKKPGEEVIVNFGQTPFVFNIDDMVNEQRERIQKEIESADTSQLEPGMSETELIQALVLQFLQHDGYVETARAFAEDLRLQKEALNLNPNMTVAGINIKDDEDANNRQRIRRAILEGDIDRALKYTNAYYPQVLEDNEQVYFKLRCRKFIEMVRKAAQLSQLGAGNDLRKSNNRHASHDMDLDVDGGDNAVWADNMETDGEHQTELMELERRMLEYGQALQAEYANDTRKEVGRALNEIWGLVAYPNPLKEPQVKHLLDRKGRVAVAEELNSAILSSLGKSSRASLETLYAQTSVLLDDLRQEGGPGAFVSLQDVIDSVQQSSQI